jgi:serine/threonine protein kinase
VRCPHCGADNRDDARFCGTCGQTVAATEPSRSGHVPPAQKAPDLTGREIGGRYRILAKLGEGGMGAVYRGEQISLKRKVAIKLLRPELSADPALVRRFNTEAELAARLSHPNTVNIYDFGQEPDGTLFIAMELVDGRSLRQVLTAEGALPPGRALAIAQQLAASLGDAHGRGIVHRDLKPDNVMLSERGKDRDVVRVLDFGIAKLREDGRATAQALQGGNALTQAGDLVGTPQYMAPEQIRGEAVDGRTDVYALGAMLYEMLTGRLPFEGTSVMAILSKHLLDTPEPPSRRRPELGIPVTLDALVMSALAKDPAQRLASMEVLAERIAALQVNPGLATPAPGASPAVYGLAQPSPFPSVPPQPYAQSYPDPQPYPSPPPSPYQPLPPSPSPYQPPSPYPQPSPYPAPSPFAPQPFAGPLADDDGPSRRGLAIGLGLLVLLAGGGAAAYFFYLRDRGADAPVVTTAGDAGVTADPWAPSPVKPDPWAPTPSPEKPDPWSPTPTPAPPPPPAPTPRTDIAGDIYNHTSGWRVIVPPGLPSTPHQQDGAAFFAGFANGATTVVGIATGDELDAADLDEASLREGAAELAASMNGTLSSVDSPVIQGKRRFRATIDVPPLRFEAVLFTNPRSNLVALYGTDQSAFAAAESARREFFERRLVAPGR